MSAVAPSANVSEQELALEGRSRVQSATSGDFGDQPFLALLRLDTLRPCHTSTRHTSNILSEHVAVTIAVAVAIAEHSRGIVLRHG